MEMNNFGYFLAGIGAAVLLAVAFLLIMNALSARREAIREELMDMLLQARVARCQALDAKKQKMMSDLKENPAAVEILNKLEGISEIIIKGQGGTFAWPGGLPPAFVANAFESVAERISYDLEESRALHQELFGPVSDQS